ncbi:unnamed protein product [Vicia faba]|uniref:Uncharacterized protein n=1 Tax=Vicia faba TaxID=3906 RepID=A0AAV1BBL7_VICFA|nr:unnamed protein product [Vicia faba]
MYIVYLAYHYEKGPVDLPIPEEWVLAFVHDFVKAEVQWDVCRLLDFIPKLVIEGDYTYSVLVPPLDRLEEDHFVQNFTLDGIFSTKSSCQLVLGHVNQVHDDLVWKKLRHWNGHPIERMFLSKNLHHGLPTNLLRALGCMTDGNLCPLCAQCWWRLARNWRMHLQDCRVVNAKRFDL